MPTPRYDDFAKALDALGRIIEASAEAVGAITEGVYALAEDDPKMKDDPKVKEAVEQVRKVIGEKDA